MSASEGTTDAPTAASRRLRRTSPRRERFWLAFDRRILYSISGIVLVISVLVFGAGVGVGRALAPLVPEAPARRAPVVEKTVAPTSASIPQVASAAAKPEPAAKVEPTAKVEPAAKVEPTAKVELRPAPSDGYGLQLGAFESEADADVFLREHAEDLAGLPLHLVPTKIPKKGIWYRVRVGVFTDKSSAEKAKRELEPELAQSAIVVSYR